ncbi:MAG: hypothetical protein WBL25_19500 [Anaerolineales bacterium]
MSEKSSLEHKEIVRLLGKLGEYTPDYPSELVEEGKSSFSKRILDFNISIKGQGGESSGDSGDEGPKGGSGGSGGSDSGGPGSPGKPGGSSDSGGSSGSSGLSGSGGSGASSASLSSGSTGLGLGISLKTAFMFGATVLLLTAAYLFREQIVDYLAENEIIRVEETAAPSFASSSSGEATEIPAVISTPNSGAPSSGIVATEPATGLGNNNSNNNNNGGVPVNNGNPASPSATPGQKSVRVTATPTAPGQGGLAGAFEFLLCILRMEGQSCQ